LTCVYLKQEEEAQQKLALLRKQDQENSILLKESQKRLD